MRHVSMTIDGEAVDTADRVEVLNPATEDVVGSVPLCASDGVDDAMAAAASAFATWRAVDEHERRGLLAKAVDEVETQLADLTQMLTLEQGKTLADARLELLASLELFRYFLNEPLPEVSLPPRDGDSVVVTRRPIGVVAAITPWNFPVHLAVSKVAPAVVTGNTVVLKPSPFTPMTTLAIGALMARHLPAGVLNVISGGDELGRAMTSHRTPRKISFTGSVATGKHVAASAATDLKRVTLELGGNDAAIVLPDADVDALVKPLFWSAFANSGQICAAVKRVYVHAGAYERLARGLADYAARVRVGDGSDPASRLGPVNNRPQFERVLELLDDAVSNGATALNERVPYERGYFVAPTIVVGATDEMRLVDEEQFGPVLPVLPYDDVDEAVARANGGRFGLSGSVWGRDRQRAADVAAQLDCGTVWVNSHLAFSPDQPISGHKWSGIGVENGIAGLESYTELQVLRGRSSHS